VECFPRRNTHTITLSRVIEDSKSINHVFIQDTHTHTQNGP